MTSHWIAPVRDFMSRSLISVRPETALAEVQRTLEAHEISSVPVVDERGTLRGILSTKDLLHVARLEISSQGRTSCVALPMKTAADLMRVAVLTIDELAPVGKAAEEMLRHRVHRLVVLREGLPARIISTRDAMCAIVIERIKTPLETVMTTDIETVDLNDPVDMAVERLDDANIRGLVVLDGRWPIGVFTHTEAFRCRELPRAMRKIPVERLMSYETICLDVATPIDRVANYARQMRVRRILAVHDNALKGIATGFDLLRVMSEPN